MNSALRRTVLVLRLAMGWLFLYAGLTKILDPAWTSAGYLKGAKTLTGPYAWLAAPQNIGWVDFLNEWSLTIIGLALILGIMTRYAAWVGMALMVLYYLPVLNFPYVGDHSYLVDEHVIYVLALFVLAFGHAGNYWGLDKLIHSRR